MQEIRKYSVIVQHNSATFHFTAPAKIDLVFPEKSSRWYILDYPYFWTQIAWSRFDCILLKGAFIKYTILATILAYTKILMASLWEEKGTGLTDGCSYVTFAHLAC